MLAAFQVGKSEVHSIEVYSSLSFRRQIIKVDGEEIINESIPAIWSIDFEVGDEEKSRVRLKYNRLTFSSKTYVNGILCVGCLFPQVIGYNALFLAIFAFVMAMMK